MGSPSDTQARQGEKVPAGVRCGGVRRTSRSLDLSLALGVGVVRTADGWALLCANIGNVVLVSRRASTRGAAIVPGPQPATDARSNTKVGA